MSLTDTKVRRTRPSKNDRWLADGNGLYLRITPAGARSWWFRQTREGNRIQDRLGSLDELTLVEARKRAANLAARSLNARTAKQLAERWYEDCVAGEHRRPHFIRGYLDRAVLPELGDKVLRKVDRADLVGLLTSYKARGTVAANQLRSVLRQMFGYGVELGWLETSPADGITKRVCGAVALSRERVLTDDEIRRVWNVGEPHQRLFRLLLLTGLRIGEMQAARWEHVRDNRLHIPATHSKNKKPHWVHLSALAVAELGERQCDTDGLVSNVSPTAVQAWLRRYCEREKIEPAFTPHDLRRTFATRINGIGIAPHVVERCLNHTMQGVMAVYNRAEYERERIEAAELWSDEIERLLGRGKRPKVVRIGKRKAAR